MANQNMLSPVSGGSGSFARHGPGTHRFFLRLTLISLLTAPLFMLNPVAQAARFMPGEQQEALTVGVLDLDANGIDEGEARAISERLRIYLGRTGVFEVI